LKEEVDQGVLDMDRWTRPGLMGLDRGFEGKIDVKKDFGKDF
jgi:hypothetical protein